MIVQIDGESEMMIKKILFWLFTIAVGFVNPLFSVLLIALYYLPKIISDICLPCNEQKDYEIKSYSDDVLEDMK